MKIYLFKRRIKSPAQNSIKEDLDASLARGQKFMHDSQKDFIQCRLDDIGRSIKMRQFNKTMNKYLLVTVPMESTDHFINNCGCLRYSHNQGRQSTVIEPAEIGEYLVTDKNKIVGESILAGQKIIVIEKICTKDGKK